jgi:hypothetical protein
MKSWLSETMTQYLGDSDADMIAFIVTQIRKRGSPQVSVFLVYFLALRVWRVLLALCKRHGCARAGLLETPLTSSHRPCVFVCGELRLPTWSCGGAGACGWPSNRV